MMQRNRSSSKRTRSPAVTAGQISSTATVHESLSDIGGSNIKEEASAPEPIAPKPVRMPAFLQLNDIEIQMKFLQITALENERLKGQPEPESQWARSETDRSLDRYTNIHPWANNRVKLQVPEGYNDYINASPVTLGSPDDKGQRNSAIQKYICMQGPKEQTVDHVWHMVWHSLSLPSKSSPAVIIMLTPTHVEHPIIPTMSVEKCFRYYPLDTEAPPLIINETSQLGENFKATVRFVEKEETEQGTAIELRKLAMTIEGHEEKIIWHFLYPGWPDFGALEEKDVESILALMALSREKNSSEENPRIVHCSAGVGRSGTFVALEYLIGELQGGVWERWNDAENEDKDPIFETVNQLRMQRRTMVQAPEQYVFLYQVLKKLWEEKYGSGQEAGGKSMSPDGTQEPPAKMAKHGFGVDGSVFE